jgi:GGDEF domain-containing protein/CHASE3 domain sensor protein
VYRIKSAKLTSTVLALAFTMAASATFQISSYRNARRMAEIGRRDAHVRDVIATLALLRSRTQDAVIGQTGYLLTGEPGELQLYERAAADVPGLLAQVRTLTADDLVQAQNARGLAPLIEAELIGLKQGLNTPRQLRLDAATDPAPIAEIRRAIDRMTEEAQAIRSACLAQTQAASSAQAHSLLIASCYRVFVLLAGCTLILYHHARRQEAEDKLRHQTLHDALTGLPNRLLLNERIQRGIERAHRDPTYRLAVLFLDLDRFKQINDSLGHAAGDMLLTSVAERLRQCVRGGDIVGENGRDSSSDAGCHDAHTVARLAGDEFTVVLEGLRTPGDAERVAGRILRELARPVELAGTEIRTAASIGIVHADGPRYASAEQLLADADAALYQAKAAGRGRYAVFGADTEPSAPEAWRLTASHRWDAPATPLRADAV